MHRPTRAAWQDEATRGSPTFSDFDAAYAQPLPGAAHLALERLSTDDLAALDDLEAPLRAFPGPLLLEQCTDERGALLHEPERRAAIASAPVLWQRFQQFCDRTPLPAVVLLDARWSAVMRAERSRSTGSPWWHLAQQ